MPATAATTAPLLSVLRSDEETLVIARDVVVAWVVVAWVAVIVPRVEAPETVRPPFNVWSALKVLAVVVPKAVEIVSAPVEPLEMRG